MGKTQAQIQKEYRERKKAKEGAGYLQKERDRVKKYYVPISQRPKKEQKERRDKVNMLVRLHRQRKQAVKENLAEASSLCEQPQPASSTNENNCSGSEISSPTVSSTSNYVPEKLIVKFRTCDPKARTRKRISRATAKSRREMEKLRKQNENLTRKYKTVSKRFERLRKKCEHSPTPMKESKNPIDTDENVSSEVAAPENVETLTSRKRTVTELRAEGITPKKIPKVVLEKLVLANVVAEEIKDAWQSNGQRGKKVIKRVISGKTIKKYRFKRSLGSLTGIKRSSLNNTAKRCDRLPVIQKRVIARKKLTQDIVTFLERDDNSRMMPGKADKTKAEGGHVQTRFLNDSMSNLHQKFVSETTTKISLATFCRMRPKYTRLTKFITRNKCLCQKHQNMALLLKSAKAAGADVPLSPDEYVKKLPDLKPEELLAVVKDGLVSIQQWAKVESLDGKMRTKIVEKEITKDVFCKMFHQMSAEFNEHVNRVHLQYKAMRDLKQNLPDGHIIVQMDFSENYTCVSAEEVQSAYWNSNTVTLHPTVVYYKSADGSLEHKSFMFVSDDNGHNIGAVYSFIKVLVPEVLSARESVKEVHYWTDSPSSQYRNKTAFYLISAHQELFGMPATWDYFESGHGKGPCDGLGGAAKMMADLSVKQGKCTIQDATDYFLWGKGNQSSVKYLFVSKADCEMSRMELSEINKGLVPVKGTMKLHSVVPVSNGKVKTSITSCYCEQCLSGNGHSDATEHNLKRAVVNAAQPTIHRAEENNNQSERDDENLSDDKNNETEIDLLRNYKYKAGDWVSVRLEEEWYIGTILEIDMDDRDCRVKFMRRTKSRDVAMESYKWPEPEDELWVNFSAIICTISEPFAIGRSGRSYRISSESREKIMNAL